MKPNGHSFTFAMVALACSVGVAGYSLYLANTLLGQNRRLEARMVSDAEIDKRREGNRIISDEIQRLETERRIAARVELERQQKARAAEQAAGAIVAQAEYAQKVGQPVELEREIAPGANMVFRLIPPGSFTMGSPPDEAFRNEDEILHPVEITKAFYMAKYEITQAQWKAVMGKNPAHNNEELLKKDTANLPVDQVSHTDALAFCAKVKETMGLPVRLPTEAEWEYACRAGTDTPSYLGPVLRDSQGRFLNGPHDPVGTYPANPFGLYDMMGNVWEWCDDWYGPYAQSAVKDPSGPKDGVHRSLRGGPWHDIWASRRSAFRFKLPEHLRWNRHGARLVLPVEAAKAKP
jgi:formylglycine-generating enzyme required for sulfatase activity